MDTHLPAILVICPKKVGQKLDKKQSFTCGCPNVQLVQGNKNKNNNKNNNKNKNENNNKNENKNENEVVTVYAKAYTVTIVGHFGQKPQIRFVLEIGFTFEMKMKIVFENET